LREKRAKKVLASKIEPDRVSERGWEVEREGREEGERAGAGNEEREGVREGKRRAKRWGGGR